jgi:hypothetical protein
MTNASRRLLQPAPPAREISELEGVEWTGGIAITAYGVRIGLRTNDAKMLDALLDCFPYGWKPARTPVVERLFSVVTGVSGSRSAGTVYLLYRGDELVARGETLVYMRDAVESQLRLYVAEHARRRVFIHAGAVAWRGRGVVIPGETMAGKSSLVAELVRAGAEYYSDDLAVFDAQGHLYPFHKPLSLRKEGSVLQRHVPVEALNGVAGTAPVPVALVVVARYRSGAIWQPQRISSGLGILALLESAVQAQRRPRAVLEALHQVAGRAAFYRGERGEASAVAAWVLEMVNETV